jgi:hypothetical protein
MDYSDKSDFWDFIGRAVINLERWGTGRRTLPHDEMIRTMGQMADDLLTFCTLLPPDKTATACEKTARFLAIIRNKLVLDTQLTDKTKDQLRRGSHFFAHILSGDLPIDFKGCYCCCTRCPWVKLSSDDSSYLRWFYMAVEKVNGFIFRQVVVRGTLNINWNWSSHLVAIITAFQVIVVETNTQSIRKIL